jgi:hypothetical protein
LLINAQDYSVAAFSDFKIMVWAFAFRWDRNRISNSVPKSPKGDTPADA